MKNKMNIFDVTLQHLWLSIDNKHLKKENKCKNLQNIIINSCSLSTTINRIETFSDYFHQEEKEANKTK